LIYITNILANLTINSEVRKK